MSTISVLICCSIFPQNSISCASRLDEQKVAAAVVPDSRH